MKVLITGKKGQLGKALIELSTKFFDQNELDIITPTRKELDLANLNKCLVNKKGISGKKYFFIK